MDLKPCPFCGSNDIAVTQVVICPARWAAECCGCGAQTRLVTGGHDEAAKAWNRRIE